MNLLFRRVFLTRAALAMASLSLVSLAAGCAPAAPPADKSEIVVLPGERHQTMRGWEVTAVMANDERPEAIPLYKDQVYDEAVDEVGIDRLRVEVRSGAENPDSSWKRFMSGEISPSQWRPLRYATVNDNDDPYTINWKGFDFTELDESVENIVLPMKERLEARGEKLFINVCYVAFTGQITKGGYVHDDPEEYAEFVLAVYLHLKEKYGVVPDAFETLLEPDNHVKQWTPTYMGKAIAAASKRLKENGFTPAFIAPSTMDMARAAPWIDGIAKVDGAIDNVVEVSYHRYRHSSRKNAERIAKTAAHYGKATSMLEWWFGNADHRVLYEDLAYGNNSSWQGRVLSTLFDVDLSDPKNPKLSFKPDVRLNRQYFHYIHFGATRIGATSQDENHIRPVAFINPDGGYVVVVSTDAAADLDLKGLPPGDYSVSYALESSDVLTPPVTVEAGADGALSTRIPGGGVITIAATGGETSGSHDEQGE